MFKVEAISSNQSFKICLMKANFYNFYFKISLLSCLIKYSFSLTKIKKKKNIRSFGMISKICDFFDFKNFIKKKTNIFLNILLIL